MLDYDEEEGGGEVESRWVKGKEDSSNIMCWETKILLIGRSENRCPLELMAYPSKIHSLI